MSVKKFKPKNGRLREHGRHHPAAALTPKKKEVMHKFILGIIAGCFFTIFHLLPGSLAAQEICPIPTTSGNATYQEGWRLQLQWAPDNPQEIAQNQSVTLHVINGTAPYTWSVVEPGFSLAENNTADDANTIFADNSACGAASITVTDSVGNSVTGYVRCTTGRWVGVTPQYGKIPHSWPFASWGGGGYPSCIFGGTKTYGKYSISERYRGNCSDWWPNMRTCATYDCSGGATINPPDHHWPLYLFDSADSLCKKYVGNTWSDKTCQNNRVHCCEEANAPIYGAGNTACWMVYGSASMSEWVCY